LKARLVAKGYYAMYDIDYQETFRVAKLTSVRHLILFVITHHWPLHAWFTVAVSAADSADTETDRSR